jgi:general secretion pathway protein H
MALFMQPKIFRSQRLETRAAAILLAREFRVAWAEAISSDHDVRVVISPVNHTFSAGDSRPHSIDRAIDIILLPPTQLDATKSGVVRFSADGSSTGGAVSLGTGRNRLFLFVEWLTGRVTIVDSQQKMWGE